MLQPGDTIYVMRLLILRHAKSSWATNAADDWERPLTDRGVRDATAIGQLLRRLNLVPDLIIASDAVRAQTTAQITAEAAGYPRKIVLSPALYHSTPAAILDVLSEAPDPTAAVVMIVAHNPGLEELVVQLTGQHVGLSTATLVHVELPIARWSDVNQSSTATLIDAWHPGDL